MRPRAGQAILGRSTDIRPQVINVSTTGKMLVDPTGGTPVLQVKFLG